MPLDAAAGGPQHAGVNLASDFCTSLTVFPPGTKSFADDPVRRMRCGGYGLFTPDRSGRYVFLVQAGRSRDVQRYRLQVEPARADDTTPGVFIRNHATGSREGRRGDRQR